MEATECTGWILRSFAATCCGAKSSASGDAAGHNGRKKDHIHFAGALFAYFDVPFILTSDGHTESLLFRIRLLARLVVIDARHIAVVARP